MMSMSSGTTGCKANPLTSPPSTRSAPEALLIEWLGSGVVRKLESDDDLDTHASVLYVIK